MSDTRGPADLYRHSLRLLLDKDIDGWTALVDDDTLFEFPYAPAGFPSKLEGREAVAAYMRGYPESIDLREVMGLEIHELRDPDTVIAEWRGVGRIVATGAPYEMPYVAVVTVKRGRITRYRDYWNPLAIMGPPSDDAFADVTFFDAS
ncbi:nuclear transport factor 2 family protein [Streptomyces sp. NBC_01012]|uniref:nuclear transport factor 2 family protein n=1 Tax=Streptomyces sp. NBC_01012 TaxID=2903717 RepID=UPI003863B7BA|nr:nuclear transport factor 2 family protein [Streptomyces sp. NBC_01012]